MSSELCSKLVFVLIHVLLLICDNLKRQLLGAQPLPCNNRNNHDKWSYPDLPSARTTVPHSDLVPGAPFFELPQLSEDESHMSDMAQGWKAFGCILIFCMLIYALQFYTFVRSASRRMSMNWTRGRFHLTDRRYKDGKTTLPSPEELSEFYFPPVNRYSISYAYDNDWVGFPSLSKVDCQEPLNSSVSNTKYPMDVDRIIPADFLEDTNSCERFVNKYGYQRYPSVSSEELEFPIAFIILFHKDLDQVNFLLRAVYRPHNVYCLSVDTKSSVEFLEATRSIARCLPNVFVSSKLENIVYAGFSRLMADLHCFDDLLTHSVQWKYVINEPGQAFPLRTNLEMVRILKLFNGTNDVVASVRSRIIVERFKAKWEYMTNKSSGETTLRQTSVKHSPPPHGLEVVKCGAYFALTRAFVRFTVTDKIAKDLLEWAKSVYSPDELYWATLNYNTVVPVPGGFSGVPNETPYLSSFTIWKGEKNPPCATMFVRDICILTPADLPVLVKEHAFFANKFYITHHPAALHCLDQLIYNVTFSRAARDMEFYQSLDLTSRGGVAAVNVSLSI